MKRILSILQVIMLVGFLAVAVRNIFFGWQSFTYVVASAGCLIGGSAWLELIKRERPA